MTSRISGLALALVLGAATAGLAQQPDQQQHARAQRGDKQEQSWQGHRQHRGFGALLKGIDLTAQQKDQLKALRQKRGGEAREGQQSQLRDQYKTARERGDTVTLRRLREERFEQMKEHREQMLKDIRGILTPAQREVFDRNVADAQKRFEQRGERGGRGAGFRGAQNR